MKTVETWLALAYKPDVDDMRESPTFKIFDLLKGVGAEIDYYDPFIPKIWPTREHAEWTGKESITWNKETVSSYDAVVISTNHSAIDYAELAGWSDCIIDTRNAMRGIEAKDEKHIFKA
ncbi:MAG: UDP binding domain-containing protein [Balneolaceae bacterium]